MITAADVAEVREDFRRQTGLKATPADVAALLEERIAQEVLYREALFRGLDRGDRSVRQRLIDKMRFLNDDPGRSPNDLYRDALALGLDRDDIVIRRMLTQKMRLLAKLPVDEEPPSEADVRAYFDAHAEEYRQPPRVSIHHVFVSRERRGDEAESTAQGLRRRLVAEGVAPEKAVGLGDPFPLGHVFRSSAPRQLEKVFGGEFAAAVFELEPRVWSAPVRSAYGLHVVWVSDKEPSKIPPFEAVRSQVERRHQTARRQERLERMIRELRGLYDVRIEEAVAGAEDDA